MAISWNVYRDGLSHQALSDSLPFLHFSISYNEYISLLQRIIKKYNTIIEKHPLMGQESQVHWISTRLSFPYLTSRPRLRDAGSLSAVCVSPPVPVPQ